MARGPGAISLSQNLEGESMKDLMARRNPLRCPAHPGELIGEAIAATGRGKSEIAALLDISRQHLHDLVECRKPVTAVTAVKLGKLFGNGGSLWLRMQAAYDLWNAANEIDLSAIPTIGTAA